MKRERQTLEERRADLEATLIEEVACRDRFERGTPSWFRLDAKVKQWEKQLRELVS